MRSREQMEVDVFRLEFYRWSYSAENREVSMSKTTREVLPGIDSSDWMSAIMEVLVKGDIQIYGRGRFEVLQKPWRCAPPTS